MKFCKIQSKFHYINRLVDSEMVELGFCISVIEHSGYTCTLPPVSVHRFGSIMHVYPLFINTKMWEWCFIANSEILLKHVREGMLKEKKRLSKDISVKRRKLIREVLLSFGTIFYLGLHYSLWNIDWPATIFTLFVLLFKIRG